MKKAGIVVLVLVICYFGVIPMFWPEPKVTVLYPPKVRIGEKFTMTVQISALHGLFQVNEIRFVPDAQQSTAIDSDNPAYPMQLFAATPKKYGSAHHFMRLTRPVTRTMQVAVDLSDADIKSKLTRGELAGKIDVSYTCASYSLRTISSREITCSKPFLIRVLAEVSGT